jgi:hypothetical protein
MPKEKAYIVRDKTGVRLSLNDIITVETKLSNQQNELKKSLKGRLSTPPQVLVDVGFV